MDEFLYWKFPDLKTETCGISAESESISNLSSAGGSGRVENLRSRVHFREIEIKALKGNGRFPDSSALFATRGIIGRWLYAGILSMRTG